MRTDRTSIHLLPGLALALGVALAAPAGAAAPPLSGPVQPVPYDPDRLAVIEDLAESIANDLLAFSVAVRDGDLDEAARYLADRVRTAGFPRPSLDPRPGTRFLLEHGWVTPSAPVERARADVLATLNRMLSHFSSLEDVRFKVKGTDFADGATADGEVRIGFFLIGRDPDGRREWMRGRGQLRVVRPDEGPWRIRAMRLEDVRSMVSEIDLFSEVALPAGVHAVFPPFGSEGNEGFLSHGAAVADVNADGFLDLAVTGPLENLLYVSRGDGTFENASDTSLIRFAPAGTGALFLDYDNDGDPDLFLAASGNQILLQNRFVPDGAVRFLDVSEEAGVSVPAVGFSAVAGDVNADSYPDIYVASYNRYGYVMPNSWSRATNGTPNRLFLSQGDGTFREAARQWQVADGRWSYAAAFADLDEDGDLDLYVANDFGENGYYRNEGDHFAEVAGEVGLEDPGFGMGVSFGDPDNDGDLDLHVTNMSSTAGQRILSRLYPEERPDRQFLDKLASGNSIYENLGDGRFQRISASLGGLAAGWAFGGGFLDFDNDGWEDVYTPNGFVSGKSMKDT